MGKLVLTLVRRLIAQRGPGYCAHHLPLPETGKVFLDILREAIGNKKHSKTQVTIEWDDNESGDIEKVM